MQAAKEFEADGDTHKAGRSSIIPKVFYEKKNRNMLLIDGLTLVVHMSVG
jgi:hypothetical protein